MHEKIIQLNDSQVEAVWQMKDFGMEKQKTPLV